MVDPDIADVPMVRPNPLACCAQHTWGGAGRSMFVCFQLARRLTSRATEPEYDQDDVHSRGCASAGCKGPCGLNLATRLDIGS
jgi:hypothetical protein